METKKFTSIDEYHDSFPDDVKQILDKIRETIGEAAPHAQEVISYGMPAFKQHGMLVYYAAWKSHIGLYPASAGINAFAEQLAPYERSKGTIKFPLDQPIPYALISEIVKFRVEENEDKFKSKKKK